MATVCIKESLVQQDHVLSIFMNSRVA